MAFLVALFTEEDKNRLIEEARNEVKKDERSPYLAASSKIHKSARDTLEAIAKSFGANKVEFVLTIAMSR